MLWLFIPFLKNKTETLPTKYSSASVVFLSHRWVSQHTSLHWVIILPPLVNWGYWDKRRAENDLPRPHTFSLIIWVWVGFPDIHIIHNPRGEDIQTTFPFHVKRWLPLFQVYLHQLSLSHLSRVVAAQPQTANISWEMQAKFYEFKRLVKTTASMAPEWKETGVLNHWGKHSPLKIRLHKKRIRFFEIWLLHNRENWGLKKDTPSDCSLPELKTLGAFPQEVVPWNETDPHMGTIILINTSLLKLCHYETLLAPLIIKPFTATVSPVKKISIEVIRLSKCHRKWRV